MTQKKKSFDLDGDPCNKQQLTRFGRTLPRPVFIVFHAVLWLAYTAVTPASRHPLQLGVTVGLHTSVALATPTVIYVALVMAIIIIIII